MARKIKDIHEFYNFMDELSIQLKQAGFNQESEEIYILIHKTAWTTSSELLGELKISLAKIKKAKKLPATIIENIKVGINTINYFRYGVYMPERVAHILEAIQNNDVLNNDVLKVLRNIPIYLKRLIKNPDDHQS